MVGMVVIAAESDNVRKLPSSISPPFSYNNVLYWLTWGGNGKKCFYSYMTRLSDKLHENMSKLN